MSDVPLITLNDGARIPQVGLGVFQIPDGQTSRTVRTAIALGYRSIDTAAVYRNESGVGRGVRDCGVPRQDLFVTTKVWNNDHGYDSTRAAFDASRARLGLDEIDLYLIHWPCPRTDRYVDTWRALIDLRDEGKVGSIGVSNFMPEHLTRLIEQTGVVPALNQIELHPRLQQEELRALHAEHGIATEAWSPLAQAQLLDDPLITGIAADHGVSAAQVVLRWHIQLGTIVIPKSVTPSRIAANIDLFGFTLSDAQMSEMATLNRDQRIGTDPRDFD